MSRPVYTTVTRTQGNNHALKEGIVKPNGFDLEFIDMPVLVHGFRKMVRNLEFDISEMAATTYLCAREHGVKFTALPIFLVRDFHHKAISYNVNSGIKTPQDLMGRRVGVNRGYTVTTGVWARGFLQSEYGVDLNKITWVLSGDEHVADYQPPANVVPIEDGKDMEAMLISGELDAAIGIAVEHENIRTLIDQPFDAAVAAVRDQGIYPINHLMVVRDDVLEQNPDIAAELFDLFVRSKQLYLETLRNGGIAAPTKIDQIHAAVDPILGDPLPYGIESNRLVLETLVKHARDQNIITKPVEIDSLFAPACRDLNG